MAFQRLALAFFSPMKRHNLMATMLAAASFGVINWPLPHFYEPQKPKRKCLLPDCENLTAHNGGYCCADHCKNHKKLKQWTRATQTNTKPTGARMSGSAYWPIWKHMADNHGLTLLDSECEDILQVADRMHPAGSASVLELGHAATTMSPASGSADC
jgi:hypothetical protein